MPGMRDVAKRAGVSLSTVSAVLGSSGKYVSEGIARRVLDASEELGYFLPSKKSASQKAIAAVLCAGTSIFFSNVLTGIEETVAQDKNLLLYCSSNYSFDKERSCLRTLRRQSLLGVILNSVCPADQENDYLEWLKENFTSKGIPVVFLERLVKNSDFYSIYLDNFRYAYESTEHLIQKGRRRIAHIMGKDRLIQTIERLNGYREALRAHNIPFDPDLVQQGDFTPYSGYMAAKRVMDICPDITAVFSANDQMAVGAIKAITQAGLSVPEDIAVAGFDNLSISSLISPALTTVNVPTYQMGRMAAQIILKASKKQPCPKQNKLEGRLVIRRSSQITATNDWELTGW